ncbi:hypothetical protein CH373_14270 [Leptospira perolatii]|uniref:Uncharacterized protein n=1 Tax=Leptospira perolatii TaxID=2023191 RepID=A0A2M9ZKK1_9LEPT|nr:hypothetical protein [Leptospira perolatii]PJZ68150.1 hypothetical protein CH360_17790 [Leptospira perolatii]PJZ72568.1 hypothetical protein CH373_14270 [Leptospira perolatii]
MASYLDEPEFPKLISAYRSALVRRYSKENIQKYPKFSNISSDQSEVLLKYFLELLYPEYEGRKRLDSAFSALAGFVHSPSKVFGLLGSIGSAIFKLGRYLKSAFQAGFAALHSYVTAHRFEGLMFLRARELLQAGMDIDDPRVFNLLLASVPKKDAEVFREDVVRLFGTLSNRDLLRRILELMNAVVSKMKSKPKVYTPEDILGIELGAKILSKGEELFRGMTDEEMKLILEAIDTIEKDSFEDALRVAMGH